MTPVTRVLFVGVVLLLTACKPKECEATRTVRSQARGAVGSYPETTGAEIGAALKAMNTAIGDSKNPEFAWLKHSASKLAELAPMTASRTLTIEERERFGRDWPHHQQQVIDALGSVRRLCGE